MCVYACFEEEKKEEEEEKEGSMINQLLINVLNKGVVEWCVCNKKIVLKKCKTENISDKKEGCIYHSKEKGPTQGSFFQN